MSLLLGMVASFVWTFYVALLIDRPDLARTVHEPWPLVIHVGFVVVFLLSAYRFSHREIVSSTSWWRHGPGIYVRNLVVIGLGVGLILFTCREVLHGVDPSGVRKLW